MILAWMPFQRASRSSAWNLVRLSSVRPAINRQTPDSGVLSSKATLAGAVKEVAGRSRWLSA
jgi:hypothetical protein